VSAAADTARDSDTESGPPGSDRRRDLAAAGLTGLTALLPFLPGLLRGRAFYFRDLALQFFPLRRFVVDGLRAGEVRWWNPHEHEGEPLSLPPLSYPPDLLQALWPDERGFSWLLALHVALAAVACFALARRLGLVRAGAATAGLAFALGGFSLSCLNLYVYAQALAWAPLLAWGVLRAGAGARFGVTSAAGATALCLSTTGIEVAAQALLAAALLGPRRQGWRRAAAAVALGAALAALPLSVVGGQVAESARGAGFSTEVVLAHSVHPLTLAQVLVSAFHGDPAALAERWWGQNFFPRGFPYFLSLYLGATVLALAGVGMRCERALGRRLAVLFACGLVVSLGRWAGWQWVLEAAPALRVVRYPSKAFFSVHLAAALLAGLGVHALLRGDARRWRRAALAIALAATPLLMAPLLVRAWPAGARWFAGGFFPPDMAWSARLDRLQFVAADAAAGGAVALLAGAVAGAAAIGRLRPAVGAATLAGLVAADLLRAGAGLNPMLPLAALRPSPATLELAQALQAEGGRVFACEPEASPAYFRARQARGSRHEVWTMWASLETLSPSFNVPLEVPTAYGIDRTMLVPLPRLLPDPRACASIDAIAETLRRAGVAHVLSLDPLTSEALRPRGVLRLPRLEPLEVFVYALADPWPLRELRGGRIVAAHEDATRLEWTVEAGAPGRLVVRDAAARGWTATVNGAAVRIDTVEGWHRAVAVPAGLSRVVMRYQPPWRGGAAVALATALAAALGLRWQRRRGATAPSPAARRRS
jgi:hypothetical protein